MIYMSLYNYLFRKLINNISDSFGDEMSPKYRQYGQKSHFCELNNNNGLAVCYLFHSTKIGRISSRSMISGFCETPVTDKIPKRKIRKVRFKFTTLYSLLPKLMLSVIFIYQMTGIEART